MAGVDILTTTEVATGLDFCEGMFWGAVILSVIIGVIFSSVQYFTGNCDAGIYLILIPMTFIGVILGVLAGMIVSEPAEYETQYKVTISDEVNFNEFVEKYEVIEQDGKIYTVRERENESNN
jgi:hypothetical protein